MKVTKVIIEGFHNVVRKEYSFDEINYLHGKNGAGKSTVLQAIQLGLLGYVPGSNKTKQGVFAHSNNHTMAVKLFLNDGAQEVTIQRVWNQVKSSVSETVTITPEGYDITALISDVELPLFNFNDFTHMTANTLKDWFINYLPKTTFKTNWDEQLREALKDRSESLVDDRLISDSADAIKVLGLEGVEEVRQANTYFKNQLSFYKAELARKIGTIQSLIHYDDYVETYTEDELKELIKSTEQNVVKASLLKQSIDRAEAIRRELEGLEDSSDSVEEESKKLQEIDLRVNKIDGKIRDLELQYRDLVSESRSYDNIIKSKGICIFTQKICSEIGSLRDQHIIKQQELSVQMDHLDHQIRELQSKKQEYQVVSNKLRDKVYKMLNDSRRCTELKATLAGLPTDTTVPDIEFLQNELESYKEMYGKAVANRQYNELNSIVVQDKYRLENTIECLKLWVKLTDVNGLQTQSGTTNPFESLASNIDKVLNQLFEDKSVKCKFNSEGKANSFSFGIDRGGVYVPYTLLSSGEKCLFILSMFIGLLEYTHSPLKLVLIDDFLDHLDNENFESVFKSLESNTSIQYVFAGVKPLAASNCNIIEV